MSSSRNKARRWKNARVYTLLALFCAVFSAVYEAFSHGVWSRWMVLLALWPLLGGALPYALAAQLGWPNVGWRARWCHAAALAVCAAGSAIKGVLEIYGTDSDLLIAYPFAALLLFFAAAAFFIAALIKRQRKEMNRKLPAAR